MIDSVQTLKNLHEMFPKFTLDDLFSIMGCIVEVTPSVYNPLYGQIAVN